MSAVEHMPVLYRETLEGLAVRPGEQYIDCTAGSGGHARGILEDSAPDGRLLALDTDPEAIERMRSRLQGFGSRMTLIQANFRDLETTARREGIQHVDGILFDLGVSSVQLGTARRGFSFQDDGPLDMRLDPTGGVTAADLVQRVEEGELADILRRYGEEPMAGRIAAAIVRERTRGPLATTAQLANLVARVKGRRGRIHPATTVFQALRIAVNGELESIALALPQAIRLLRPGGRLAVIAFHSLEDRIVKHRLRAAFGKGGLLTKKPVRASDAEVAVNPRARSALLRAAMREQAAP